MGADSTISRTTRERLIEAAARRFYHQGFREVGIDQIYKEVGISKTAFYKHFSGKDELMLAVMEHEDQWLRRHFLTMIDRQGGKHPQDRLLALFDVVDEIVKGDEYRGCFFVNVAIEFPLQHDPPHIAAAANKRAMQDVVVALAKDAGADDPQELARELMLLMEGAYVTRHVTGDQRAGETARRAAQILIERRLPSG
ncbi:MAG: TetR/AcrR family transcriptional regulator [Phycisphaeraceae bacterium]|nr:TetR/AcrR family transcriptional regulator [Phycisphaeraceae bacterium]